MLLEEYFGGRARLMRVEDFIDQRGKLLPIPFVELPFAPKRCFCISQVIPGVERGKHAHRTGSQLLFCLGGRVDVLMHDGKEEETVSLTDNSTCLLIGPRIWSQQTYVTEGAVLMVLASHDFDRENYVTDIGDLA